MLTPAWEEKLVALLNKANIQAYPLVSPLESNHAGGHVVYSLVTDEYYNSFEGNFVESVLVSLDARSEDYAEARDLLKKSYDALNKQGRHRARFVLDRDAIRTEFDSTTRLYRFIVNVSVNPYYMPKPILNDRSFSLSFSGAFG